MCSLKTLTAVPLSFLFTQILTKILTKNSKFGSIIISYLKMQITVHDKNKSCCECQKCFTPSSFWHHGVSLERPRYTKIIRNVRTHKVLMVEDFLSVVLITYFNHITSVIVESHCHQLYACGPQMGLMLYYTYRHTHGGAIVSSWQTLNS